MNELLGLTDRDTYDNILVNNALMSWVKTPE